MGRQDVIHPNTAKDNQSEGDNIIAAKNYLKVIKYLNLLMTNPAYALYCIA